jgi:perosamine synthetase
MKINQIEPYLSNKESAAVAKYLKSGGWLTEFKKTEDFERRISEYIGVKHAVLVPSGTVALYLALLSVGIKPGDKVAVPNYTMIATINVIKWAGAEPIIFDVNEDTMCMDFNAIKSSLSSFKAILYVAINGRSGNMNDYVNYCKDNNLFLIEDSAQAMGSCFENKFLGTFGDLGVFSLTPHKIITTGQGGIIVTNNSEYYSKVKALKDFSRTKPGVDIHNDIGYNFKFTDIQSVIGIEQIKTIDFRIQRKKKLYENYYNKLVHLNEIQFFETDLDQVTPWAIDIVLKSKEIRDDLAKFLLDQGIGTRIFYPALNSQLPYSYFESGSFPISESITERGLWLPSSIGLRDDELEYICDNIIEYFK